MIHFKTVKWKNFLSTGNSFTEIQLDKRSSTLIVGENGSGKSTMLDAICFGLFGKPYRNINKPQLVNSINGKQCLVEIEFSIGKKNYKVIRGIKPTIFEIWVNGEMIDQSSASRDYQKFLEDGILKLNYKSFTQIVILGSASFTPFMQLPAAARREVIEDILDIKIFSSMNVVLKEKINLLKDKIKDVESKISIAKNKAEVQQEYIKNLEDDREARLENINDKISEASKEIESKKKVIDDILTKKEILLTEVQELDDITEQINDIVHEMKNFESLSKKIEKEISFYHDNDTCPKCKQGIEHDFKEHIVEEQKEELLSVEEQLNNIKQTKNDLTHRLNEIKKVSEKISLLNNDISNAKSEVNSSERYIQRLELEKADLKQKVGNIETEKEKLKMLAKETVSIIKEKGELSETYDYYEIATLLLKDSGIKTRIIKQYLPVINKLVNKYLTAMDFFVQFTLDEKFKEIIKSRYRDDFSYQSFSEGEKQRIDLALLFTWRTIAKLKNSASTNLLILDEVFDSSLDSAATDYVMTLLNTLGDGTNVWVISHKGDQLFDKFQNVVRFIKKKNFSIVAPPEESRTVNNI